MLVLLAHSGFTKKFEALKLIPTKLKASHTLFDGMLSNQPDWEKLYRATIYAVKHELVAPCRQVCDVSELLLQKTGRLDAEAVEMLNRIKIAGAEAQAMLDGLQKLSLVYSEPIRLSVVDSRELSERFSCSIDPGQTEAHICGDLDKLEKAAQELSDNAELYGTFGGFRLTTRPKWLSLTTIDTGPGIVAGEWSNSLQPFARIGQRRTPDNVGMGLPIALAIAEQMRGTLVNQPNGVSIEIPAL